MNQSILIPHLFRKEYSKLVAVLCNLLGPAQIDTAQDIVSETFQSALESWPYRGVPANPTAWLYLVAKNKTKNLLLRKKIFDEKIVPNMMTTNESDSVFQETELSEQTIQDSQLRMMFAVCSPSIPVESQVSLALRILCGFGIDEIATALLTSKDVINKRLYRAKEKLKSDRFNLSDLSQHDVSARLNTVLTTLYLLFNEGYYSETNDKIINKDLAEEAILLCELLTLQPRTDLPKVHALLSLMYFQSSRFDARINPNEELVLYHEQDPSRWNQELISKGILHLYQSTTGEELSNYHFEASIAYWYTRPDESTEKWNKILELYDILLKFNYSEVANINRLYAYAKVHGYDAAIKQSELCTPLDNPYFYSLMGELYSSVDSARSDDYYIKALQMVKSESERKLLLKKLRIDSPDGIS